MALLLDTRTLPAGDRIEATNAALADTDVPAIFRYDTVVAELLGPRVPRAGDVDPDLAKVLAVGQRPLAGVAFTEKATAAAWKTRPAWGSVAINDHTINPDVERFGYKRAGMTTIEIESSHLVMLSHPKEVTDLIRTAIAGSQ